MSATTLYDRDGATTHVHVLESVSGRGIWITDSMAAQLNIRAGDTVGVDGKLRVRVTAVYANLQDAPRPLPWFWCSQETGRTGFIGPPDADSPPPPLTLVGRREFEALASSLQLGEVAYQWQRALSGRAITEEQGRAVVSALSLISDRLPPTPSPRESQMLPTDTSFVVARSGAIGEAVGHSVSPVSLAGVALALLLVASAGSYWVDRRQLEVNLLRSRGISSAMIGVKASLEMGPWAVVGSAAGASLARMIVGWLGPSSVVANSAFWSGVRVAAGATVAGVLVLGAVAAFRARGLAGASQSHQGSPLRLLPLDVLLLAVAGVAWWRLTRANPDLAPAGALVASIGPLYLAFPVLMLLGATGLLTRGFVPIMPRARRRLAKGPVGPFLGVARLAASPRLGAALFASSAYAVGLFLFAAGLTLIQRDAVGAKAKTFVGSRTAVYLAQPGRVPQSLRATTTEVERLQNAYVGTLSVDVLGIDPATFWRAAFWTPAYGAGSPAEVRSLLSSTDAPTGTLTAIVANGSLGRHPKLTVPSATGSVGFPLWVVKEVPSFTLANGSIPLVVTDVDNLRGFPVDVELLSRSDLQVVVRALSQADDRFTSAIRADNVLDQTEFLSVTWSLAYLETLGVLVGLIVVAGTFLYIETRQRSRAVAYAMARRMGLSRSSHLVATLVELGLPLFVGAGAGIGLGLTATALVYGSLNPLPDLPPTPLFSLPVLAMAGAAAAALMTMAAGALWSQRGVEGASPGQLLRGEQ